MKFGLFFFGLRDQPADLGESAYSSILDAARFADRNSLAFVSTPERHFSVAGGLFPNPVVTGAAIAASTSRVQIRAGSLLLPMADPVRLVEDWSMLDVMSCGRVAMGFTMAPDVDDPQVAASVDRSDLVAGQTALVRGLWRTRRAQIDDGHGVRGDVTLFPEPATAEVPLWISVGGAGPTFAEAGRLGVNVLTGLDGRDLPEFAADVECYRRARTAAGFAGNGVVTLLQPTYVSDEPADLRAATADLERHLSRCGPASRFGQASGSTPAWYGAPRQSLAGGLPAAVAESSVTVTVHRAPRTTGAPMVGPVPEAARWVRALEAVGVDEVACVVDFVDDPDLLRRGLPGIAALHRTCGCDADGVRTALDRFMGWG